MTDKEIIQALENEVKSTEYVDSDYCDGVDLTLIKSAIDLINRQKTEIERLQNTINDILDRQPILVERAEKYAKSEAYKEFAERLKDESQMADCFDSYNMVVGTHFINNLLKEMIDE